GGDPSASERRVDRAVAEVAERDEVTRGPPTSDDQPALVVLGDTAREGPERQSGRGHDAGGAERGIERAARKPARDDDSLGRRGAVVGGHARSSVARGDERGGRDRVAGELNAGEPADAERRIERSGRADTGENDPPRVGARSGED